MYKAPWTRLRSRTLAPHPTPQSPDFKTHLVQVVRFFVLLIFAQKAWALMGGASVLNFMCMERALQIPTFHRSNLERPDEEIPW
ncbi:hypothetical protein KSB_59520 [Ktedonobacter robiniae]|uniref:Uncharacterized protein n=1 Tax=Ktedonobacter robiniae TaxID=2778365 RepID=A0ABQ3UYP6_9CHLR|nr:hypothetical protein KSB_59520 [Ktedonobacter robiniae]